MLFTEASFQVLHATHSLERLLENFLQRGAVFEVVFWNGEHPVSSTYKSVSFELLDARHMTVQTGSHNFVFASRLLARSILLEHLQGLNIPVHTFSNIADPRWLQYATNAKVCSVFNVLLHMEANVLLAYVHHAERWRRI